MTRKRVSAWMGIGVFLLLTFLAAAGGSPAATREAESELCSTCHEETARGFQAVTHGKTRGFELLGASGGCTACHGDGTAHMDAGGDAEQIRRMDSDTDVDDVTEVCMTCHRSKTLHDWSGSVHPMHDVGCTDCHSIHETKTVTTTKKKASSSDVCFECHRDVQAAFAYPSHHPLREGNMDCTSCHLPHGSSIGMVRNDESMADLCLECHTEYQGPFVFEHEAVYEGCDTCHTPHGSVANKLLVQNEPFLCMQCHEMHFHAGLEAEPGKSVFIPRYDPNSSAPTDGQTFPGGMVPNPFGESGYKMAFTTKCTQCHTRVHGSDLPSQTVPGMGKGLAR